MKICQKCGMPLGFRKITKGKGKGKWCPTNPDGSDHWDTCREERLKDPAYRAYVEVMDREAMRPVPTYHGNKHIKSTYSGNIPPWEFPTFIKCVE